MPTSSSYEFRRHAAGSRQIIEQMQPDPARRWWCLGILADSLQAAHRAHPERWGVTLRPDPLRLNVGRIEVYFFNQADRVYFVLDAATLVTMPETHQWLDNDAVHHLASYQHGGWTGDYASVPGSVGCYVELDALPHAYPILRPAHQALITLAAQTLRHSETRESHSPGVIDYLREETGWLLPQPAYADG